MTPVLDLEQLGGRHRPDSRDRHLPVDDRADGAAGDELPASVETRDGPACLAGHAAVPVGAVEARHRPAEPEVVGERNAAEVPALRLPGVVVPGDDLLCRHLDLLLDGLVLYLLRHRSAAKLLAGQLIRAARPPRLRKSRWASVCASAAARSYSVAASL